MKKGEVVYIKTKKNWLKCVVTQVYEECGGTAKVSFGGAEELTCRQSQLITPAAYKEIVKQRANEARIARLATEMDSTIRMFNQGHTTPEEMEAHSINIPADVWKKRLKRARKQKLIGDYPLQNHEQRPTD